MRYPRVSIQHMQRGRSVISTSRSLFLSGLHCCSNVAAVDNSDVPRNRRNVGWSTQSPSRVDFVPPPPYPSLIPQVSRGTLKFFPQNVSLVSQHALFVRSNIRPYAGNLCTTVSHLKLGEIELKREHNTGKVRCRLRAVWRSCRG